MAELSLRKAGERDVSNGDVGVWIKRLDKASTRRGCMGKRRGTGRGSAAVSQASVEALSWEGLERDAERC